MGEQAKIRLDLAIAEIEAPLTAPPMASEPTEEVSPSSGQRVLMWQSLADLMLVYYPAWQAQTQPTPCRAEASAWPATSLMLPRSRPAGHPAIVANCKPQAAL